MGLRSVTVIFIIVSLCLLWLPHPVDASTMACNVSVGTNSINGGTSAVVDFNVVNNDEQGNLLHWVKITSPSTNFVITSGDGPNIGGVTVASDGSSVDLQTTLSNGETGTFPIGMSAGNEGVSAQSFTVQASDSSDGTDPVTCSGDTSISIAGNTSLILAISNVTVSASDTSATIRWSTGGTTTGVVNYGSTSSYGSAATDPQAGSTHAATLTGLSASTTYHFQIVSSDADGNSVSTSDNSFTTGESGATTTVTTTTTSTVVKTVTELIKDTTAPTVTIDTKLTSAFTLSPVITGVATDESGIGGIQYSIDGGKNWIRVDISASLGAKKVSYSFKPEIIDDGNYDLVVKSIDTSGNEKQSSKGTIIIDRMPPQAGAALFSLGPLILQPDINGVINVLQGANTKITLSAVGGPISGDLIVGEKHYSLDKNRENGLWSQTIQFEKEGQYALSLVLLDGANNKTEKQLSNITVMKNGSVKDNEGTPLHAKMLVYSQNPDSKEFGLWKADAYSETNPIQLLESNRYSLLLPSGTYYIEVQIPGYRTLRTTIFKVRTPRPITTDFVLRREPQPLLHSLLSLINLAPVDQVTISDEEISHSTSKSSLVGTEIPNFQFSQQFRGKPSVFAFVSSWLPSIGSQLEVIEEAKRELPQVNFVIVGEQEQSAKFDIFMKRGNYEASYFADTDGTFITPLNLGSLPTYLFIDRKGIITDVVVGGITTDEIKSRLIY